MEIMRILFSAVPAYGHLLPLNSLSRAALDEGHDVAVLTSGDATEIVAEALPGARLLAAGVMPAVFSVDAAQRTGMDVMAPTPEVIGEIFGGSRLQMSLPVAVEVAAAWRPDFVFAEPFDAVGPFVAATLGIDWAQVGIGPAAPQVVLDAIAGIGRSTYEARSRTPRAPRAYVDVCPQIMQRPDFQSPAPLRPMQTRPHRRARSAWQPPAFPDADRPTVLVTLGTIFSTTDLLNAIVGAVAAAPVNVVATRGYGIDLERGGDIEPEESDLIAGDNIAYVPFTPLGELLAAADAVVSVGGSGTILSALAEGLPLVLWPQGADQPINAERVRAAGAAILVEDASDLIDAVTTVLADGSSQRAAAEHARGEMAQAATPAQIINELAA
jgi:UDP:flavonoid glycosyltransferase YjiC (YdhE family)